MEVLMLEYGETGEIEHSTVFDYLDRDENEKYVVDAIKEKGYIEYNMAGSKVIMLEVYTQKPKTIQLGEDIIKATKNKMGNWKLGV